MVSSMSLHYKIVTKIAFCSLFLGTLLLGGCISPKEIKNPDLESVQITSLRIEDKDNPNLKNTFFSIDHREGIIYNAHLLPKDLALDSVKVVLARHSDAQVKFIIGGKQETSGSNDSLSFVNWKQGVSIQLSNSAKNMNKEYKLDIRTYSYDPQTFNWQVVSGAQIPNLTNVKKLLLKEHQDKLLLFVGNTANKTVVYASSKSNPSQWTLINTTGLEGSVKDVTITPLGVACLLTENNDFYLSSTEFTEWASANIGSSVVSILGSFVEPGEKKSTIALILRNGSTNKLHFGTLEGSSVVSGELVPEDFPIENFTSISMKVAQHPMLVLVGSHLKNGTSQKAQTWTSTSGKDWLRLPSPEGSNLGVSVHEPVLLYDETIGRMYCLFPAHFAEANPQMKVFFSDDKGVAWTEGNGTLMLPPTPFGIRSKHLVGYFATPHTLYFLGGMLQDGSIPVDVWKGTPRIYTE